MEQNQRIGEGAVRRIEKRVVPVNTSDGAGVVLKRVIGSLNLSYADPFLLLDHFGSNDPDDYIAGFPMHPHRGIETVTYVLKGAIKHRDSKGNEGIIRSGAVQWMTAGSGILHEEMPQMEDGNLEGFQLWVNLPAVSKMTPPKYQEFGPNEIPVSSPGEGIELKVIAGEYGGVKGPVTGLEAAPVYIDVQMGNEKRVEFDIAKGRTAFVYVYRGTVAVSDGSEVLEAPVLGLLSDGQRFEASSGKDGASFLLVHGKPLNEPVARYGPFVMNTRQEIATALEELSSGTFVK